MISGLIIYSDKDAKKNQWFITKCQEECRKRQMALDFIEEKDVLIYLNNHHPDFVIYRARNAELLKKIEDRGIRCFNPYLVNKTANDKYLTYQLFIKHGLPCLKTSKNIDDFNSFPLIMKSLSGHGGNEVYLINSKEEANRIISNSSNEYIYQEYLPNDGDLRVYVLNQQVVLGVLRKNQNDFRSNYSLGGEVSLFTPSDKIKEAAIKVSMLLEADYIGVDFLLVNDKYFINEIEDPVGARMVYQVSDIDIINLFIEDIKEKLTK